MEKLWTCHPDCTNNVKGLHFLIEKIGFENSVFR